jgi:hypothetical protein
MKLYIKGFEYDEKKGDLLEQMKKYDEDHYNNIRKIKSETAKKKKETDILYVLQARMATLLWMSMYEHTRKRSWTSLVPYSVEDLKEHLEHKFTQNMTWNDFLQGKIHIDHIMSRSKLGYPVPHDINFQKLWALDNLQPLWAKDNIKKGAK